MKLILGFQDVIEIVNNGVEALPENPTDVQRNDIEKPRRNIARLSFIFINAWITRYLKRLHMQKALRKLGIHL